MGLFSSKTKHVYNVSGSELYQDMPTLMQQTVRGTTQDNRNISKDLVANLINGVLWNVRGLHRWASVEGNYPWGLPDGTMANVITPKESVVKNAVSADVGYQVHVGFIRIEPSGTSYTYYVEYWELSPYGEIKGEPSLWTYDTADGTYPYLNIDTKYEQNTPYLPIMPIRVNNQYMDESEEGSDIRKALNFIDLNLKTLCDGMRESAKESSSDMPDDTYVVLGASVSRGTERTNEYLFRFFRRMYGESDISYSDQEYWAANKVPTETVYDPHEGYTTKEIPHTSLPPTNSLNISDARYDQNLQWDYITHRIYDGSVGKVGTHHVEKFTGSTNKYDSGGEEYTHYQSGIKIRKQLNSTQVEEFVVHGLLTDFNVVDRSRVGVTIDDVFDNPDELDMPFIIPLRMDIIRDMGNIRSHDLIYESVWMLSMHHDTYKQKWYQTGFFKIFIMVVVVVVTAIFAPQMLPAVIKGLMISMVVQAFMPLLQDVLGEELAMVVAVIATAIGLGFDPTALAESATGTLATTTTVTPTVITVAGVSVQSLAMASMQLYAGLTTLDLKDQMEDLSTAIDELTAEIKEYEEESEQTAYDVGITMAGIKSDPWHMLDPSQYVSNVLNEPKKPLKGPLYIQHYVDASLHLDIPKTVLNLGHA